MATVRFGLIGYGAWGSHHARAIAKTPGAALVAVAVRSAASQVRLVTSPAAGSESAIADEPLHRPWSYASPQTGDRRREDGEPRAWCPPP